MVFVSSEFCYSLQYFQLLQGKVMFELSIEDFGFVKIYLNVEGIIDEDWVILFVIDFKKGISQYYIGLVNILEGFLELSFC